MSSSPGGAPSSELSNRMVTAYAENETRRDQPLDGNWKVGGKGEVGELRPNWPVVPGHMRKQVGWSGGAALNPAR